jgi:hypothetical protein
MSLVSRRLDVEAEDLGRGRAPSRAELEAVVRELLEQGDVLGDPLWLVTAGVMLKMAEPRCTRSVIPEQWPRNASGPGMWLYSSRKWCCGHHTYLKAFWSAALAISTLRMIRLCSALGSASRSNFGTNSWAKTPNSMGDALLRQADANARTVARN